MGVALCHAEKVAKALGVGRSHELDDARLGHGGAAGDIDAGVRACAASKNDAVCGQVGDGPIARWEQHFPRLAVVGHVECSDAHNYAGKQFARIGQLETWTEM